MSDEGVRGMDAIFHSLSSFGLRFERSRDLFNIIEVVSRAGSEGPSTIEHHIDVLIPRDEHLPSTK